VLALALSVGAAAQPSAAQEDRYRHEDHAGLFPLCTGCHGGVPTGDTSSFFPTEELCAGCHNGVDEQVIQFTPIRAHSELRFAHPDHAGLLAAQDTTLACAGCHSQPDVGRMEVVFRVSRATCESCHEHETPDHYVTGACGTCHLPLAETGWETARIADLATPVDHEPGDPFLIEQHGPASGDDLERCTTCHTQDRCASCHVNAAVVPEIAAIAAAPASMTLPPMEARYPTPASHDDPAYLEAHQADDDGTACATCHVREDCASCHFDVTASSFGAVFVAQDVVAPGVGIHAEEPSSHESPFFMVDHGTLAASDEGLCATCHTRPYCEDCHDDAQAPAYHEPDFAQRHASDSYGRNMECASCHSTEVFCLACHVESGLTSSGRRLGVGYHDAEPAWLLRHGQAARQYLETCQSCHTQRECLQCHSQTGSFQVNPHGPDFDARRAQERNPAVCYACHITDPVGERR
jgi:hypothetical protein